jgi:hypothetical protein
MMFYRRRTEHPAPHRWPLALDVDRCGKGAMVETLRVYRADKQRFKVGDTIQTAGSFSSLNPDGAELEAIFNEVKPDEKPIRAQCFFLFENFDDCTSQPNRIRAGATSSLRRNRALGGALNIRTRNVCLNL